MIYNKYRDSICGGNQNNYYITNLLLNKRQRANWWRIEIKNFILFLLFLLVNNCRTIGPTTLIEPQVESNPTWETIVLDRVEIKLQSTYTKEYEEEVRKNLREYLIGGNYAKKVYLLEENSKPSSYDTFKFRFTRYQNKRSIHPDYYLYSILTLGFYIWFGGEITRDQEFYTCQLEILNTDRKQIFFDEIKDFSTIDSGMYSRQFYSPDGRTTRTRLVYRLLELAKQNQIKNFSVSPN